VFVPSKRRKATFLLAAGPAIVLAGPPAAAFEPTSLVIGPPIPRGGGAALGAAADLGSAPVPTGAILDGPQTAGQAPDLFHRQSASGDGTFLLLGDRVRAVIERAQPATSRSVVGTPRLADQLGDATRYWLVADILNYQGLGVSAYGTYRPGAAPQSTAVAATSGEPGHAGAGISIGLGDWKTWVEQREALALDDAATRSLFPATGETTLSGGMTYALRPALAGSLGDRSWALPGTVRLGVSRSTATTGDGAAGADPAPAVEESVRRAVELSFDWQGVNTTTTLRMSRSFAQAGEETQGAAQTARLSHRMIQGPWRTEAVLGYRGAQDEAWGIDTAVHAYEVGARFNYVTADAPDLGGRAVVGYARTDSAATGESDVDLSWQVTGTMGFAKFLPGAATAPNRRIDLNVGLRGENPDWSVGGTWPFDLTVGVNAGFKF
jgi:hypothetical protein